jgi:RNA polymerase sigma-70 factor (ECF subfamily)
MQATMQTDFHSLYERYAPDIYRFALYLSGDPAKADDITAETFVRAWTAPGEIRVGTVKAYLLVIARNLYRAGLRQAQRQTALDEHLPAGGAGPERAAAARVELQATLRALQKLPEHERAALLLHVQDGMPYTGIAAVLGMTVANVKVTIYRARVRLMGLVGHEGSQE